MKKKDEDKIIEELKGKAKIGMTEMLSALCRQCKGLHTSINDETCKECPYAQTEKLIRAFLE